MGNPRNANRTSKYDKDFLGTFKVKYMGVSMSRSGTDESAIRVAAAAVRATRTHSICKAHLVVRKNKVKLVARGREDVIFQATETQVSWHGADKVKYCIVCVQTDASSKRFYVYLLEMIKGHYNEPLKALETAFPLNKIEPNTRNEFDIARMRAMSRRNGSSSSANGNDPSNGRKGSSSSADGNVFNNDLSKRKASASSADGNVPNPSKSGSINSIANNRKANGSSSSAEVEEKAPIPPRRPSQLLKNKQQLMKRRMTMGKNLAADVVRFPAFYVGAEKVASLFGLKTAQDAYTRLRTKNAQEEADIEFVTFVLSSHTVRILGDIYGNKLVNEFTKNISYTCVLKTPDEKSDVFAFIAVDRRLSTMHCHFLEVDSGKGVAVQEAVNASFKQLALEEKKVGKGSPFDATDPSREPVPGDLFRRQIRRGHLEAINQIGAGQFGSVYLAWQMVVDERTGLTAKIKRAVKLLRSAASKLDKKAFVMESETMLQLTHPNLVALKGVALQQKPWLCVLEFMQHGDLRATLIACKEKTVVLSEGEKLNFCLQLASGMEYMADHRLIHMDLAARNCLLGQSNLIKIADFGLTRPMDKGSDHLKLKESMRLALKWIAIEGMEKKIFSEKSDVWSFGITFWEIFMYGCVPYPRTKTASIQKVVKLGLRLKRPPSCPEDVFDYVKTFWATDPLDRPTFSTIKFKLKEFLRKYPRGDRDIGATVAGKAALQLETSSSASGTGDEPKGITYLKLKDGMTKDEAETYGFGPDVGKPPDENYLQPNQEGDEVEFGFGEEVAKIEALENAGTLEFGFGEDEDLKLEKALGKATEEKVKKEAATSKSQEAKARLKAKLKEKREKREAEQREKAEQDDLQREKHAMELKRKEQAASAKRAERASRAEQESLKRMEKESKQQQKSFRKKESTRRKEKSTIIKRRNSKASSPEPNNGFGEIDANAQYVDRALILRRRKEQQQKREMDAAKLTMTADLERLTKPKERGQGVFQAADPLDGKSKIFAALNPQPLGTNQHESSNGAVSSGDTGDESDAGFGFGADDG